jgi:hypothetical protein
MACTFDVRVLKCDSTNIISSNKESPKSFNILYNQLHF